MFYRNLWSSTTAQFLLNKLFSYKGVRGSIENNSFHGAVHVCVYSTSPFIVNYIHTVYALEDAKKCEHPGDKSLISLSRLQSLRVQLLAVMEKILILI